MEQSDFQHAITYGLGRAIQHLKSHDAAPYTDIILNACLHCTAYDPQIEGSRAEYLHEIIQTTGNYAYYRDHILNAFSTSEPSEDLDYVQLLWLVFEIANSGFQPARDLLYKSFKPNPDGNDITDTTLALLALDGLAALTFMIEHSSETNWYYLHLAIQLEDYPIEDIISASNTNPLFQTQLLAEIKALKESQPIDRVALREQRFQKFAIPYDELKQSIVTGNKTGGLLSVGFLQGWGKHASEENLLLAARDLLNEDKEDRLIHYVNLFYKRPFPLDPSELIAFVRNRGELTTDEHGWYMHKSLLALRAKVALAYLHHPEVRSLALELLEEDHPDWGLDLLERNFEAGDWSRIKNALLAPNLTREVYHGLGLGIENLALEHPSPEAAHALITLYKHTPCSQCRKRIVQALHTLNLLPTHILEECKFDSNYDLRKLAQNGFIETDDN